MDAVLYILLNKAHTRIKIGITTDLRSRLLKLSTDFGELDFSESYLFADLALNITRLERTLHFMFEGWHLDLGENDAGGRTEWFDIRCLPLVLQAIADIGELRGSERATTKGIDPSIVLRTIGNQSSPLTYLLFKEYRYRILNILLLTPGESYRVRELGRLTETHAGSLHRELRALSDCGVLMAEKSGNQVLYRANTDCPIYDELASILKKV